MGTDRARLFNRAIADRILAMDQAELTRFVDNNLVVFSRKSLVINPIGSLATEVGSVTVAVEELLATDYTLSTLRSDVALDFAFGDEELLIDYWGCYAANFAGHPAGSISSLDYLPDQEEEIFLLLRPEHVGQMIRSLREHIHDLRIMSDERIQQLEEWQVLCEANRDYLVAYEFDF